LVDEIEGDDVSREVSFWFLYYIR